jgi:hypothetical protein
MGGGQPNGPTHIFFPDGWAIFFINIDILHNKKKEMKKKKNKG